MALSGLSFCTYPELIREMLVLCVMLPGLWSLGTSIRVSIDNRSVMLGGWSRKTPKKRLFCIESDTQS